MAAAAAAAAASGEEHFDVLDASGALTGERRARSEVHRLGLFHRAVHVWLLAPASGEVLLQLRAACKDSWASRWDVSSAGHVSAGETSLPSAVRELREELGLALPPERFRLLFTHLAQPRPRTLAQGDGGAGRRGQAVPQPALRPADRSLSRSHVPLCDVLLRFENVLLLLEH